jgi:hypothetical protein
MCWAYTFAIFPQVLASYDYRRAGCGHFGEFRDLALAKAPGCLSWARIFLPLGLQYKSVQGNPDLPWCLDYLEHMSYDGALESTYIPAGLHLESFERMTLYCKPSAAHLSLVTSVESDDSIL